MPRLMLGYGIADASNPLELSLPATINNLVQFSFLAEKGRSYSVQRRDSLTAGDLVTLTNPGLIAVATIFAVTDALTSSNAFCRVLKD